MGDIVADARKAGELVYEFDQGKSPVMTQPGPWGDAYSGFCAGMAMKWLALRRQGTDFAHDQGAQWLSMPHWHATRDQNVYEDSDYNTALRAYGLHVASTPLQWVGSPNGSRLRQIAQGSPGLYLVRLRREGGGHAVAIDSEKGVYRFMDANFGHFAFKKPERFEQWLVEFLAQSGYAKRYTKEGFMQLVA